MTRLDRSRLVAVFTARFEATRSIEAAVDAVAVEIESHAREAGDVLRIGPRSARRPRWTPEGDPRPAAIIAAVAAYRGVPVVEVRSSLRERLVARTRHECAWLIRVETNLSYAIIGRALGRLDHTTVLSSCRKMQELVDQDPDYGARLRSLVAPSVERRAA